MSTIEPAAMASKSPSNAHLEAELLKLREGLHRAYCVAVCLDRALRYVDSDDSPELAVCVNEYLVRPLDALSFEANLLYETVVAPGRDAETRDSSDASHDASRD
jgi:hypothetical protein